MPAMIFLVGIISGVALRSIINVPQIFILAIVLAACISLLYVKASKNTALVSVLIFIIGCSVGVFRVIIAESHFNFYKSKIGNTYTGIVDEIPVESEYAISFRTKTDYGYVLTKIEKGSEVQYGDALRFVAQCELPEDFETNTGVMFDYDAYLMARSMHHICKAQSFEIIEKDAGSMLQGKLYELRVWFTGYLDKAFADPYAGLIKGVLLGDKSGLSDELTSEMTVAGVIHIAVLSGSNIAMVAALIFGFSKSLPYNIRIVLTVFIVFCFVLLSGAEPPAVRAGILVAAMFLGKFIHRKLHTGRALLLIAVIMIMKNPFALVFDMSFQLSFLATIGIVYAAPIMEQFLQKVTERWGLREVIAGTLGAQVVVTPLILYSTGSLSIVSLPANILIGWAVPILMSIGFVAGVLNIISAFIAMPMVFLAELFSKYIISITKISAHLPYAQILLPFTHVIYVWVMYIILFFTLWRLRNGPQKVSN